MTTFNLPVRIVYGAGSITRLGREATAIGRKAMIVTYPDIRRVGLLDRVIEDLKSNGVDTLVFEEVEPNPRSSTVDKGANIARSEKIDLIIGLGGGSAMDTAKGIALASSGTESVWSYILGGTAEVKGPVPPLIQVPTMAGTGSEINAGAVITNWETHVKTGIGHRSLWAKLAIIDPEVTLTVPEKQTKAGAADIFSHVVERYVTDDRPSPMTDGIRETVMKMVVEYLPKALARLDDIEARTQLSVSSATAMSSFVTWGDGAGVMSCHSVEHALSGYYDVTHGEGLAALLPAWMKFYLPEMKERFDLLGQNVFGKKDGIQATEEWLQSVGMRLRLRNLGCELERADEIAELAIQSAPGLDSRGPKTIDARAIAQIYRDSY
ncbi:MAG: iron-containing alcohol dehydrogenase [Dehalococcoidales bacterium]|nr:MAG: iron-containing alcohol dehydrogenase [Dehalococcoidales bacterium]